MNDRSDFIRSSIIRDMAEGVMTIGLNGVITSINGAASQILCRNADELVGHPFVRCFFGEEKNDDFNQAVLDAVYESNVSHERIVPYDTGTELRQLHMTTSYLHDGEERVGIIVVLSDITELAELRDAVRAMEKIKALNTQLEMRNQLLSETFGRFLSDDIVKQLLDTPDGLALGGKKATLTTIMSDLRGFTALSERMSAQDLLTMLNHYLGEMTEIIQQNNGTIIEFIGDGIMAIFGAPKDSEHHAAEAVTAAVEMEARMPEINRWNEAHGFPALEMGIGVHTGDVIVGNIGSEKRTKYGVTGRNVNLCGRIESFTVGGQVLVSETTKKEITLPLSLDGEQQIKPKGADEPITVYAVDGIGDVSCRHTVAPPEKLPEPLFVPYYILSGKSIGYETMHGFLVALSADEAEMKTDEPLEAMTNIQLDIGEKLFAKVIETADGVSRIRFTARPEHFDAWLQMARLGL